MITFKKLPLESRYAVSVDGKHTGIVVWSHYPNPSRSLRVEWTGQDKHGRIKNGPTRRKVAETLVRMMDVPVK